MMTSKRPQGNNSEFGPRTVNIKMSWTVFAQNRRKSLRLKLVEPVEFPFSAKMRQEPLSSKCQNILNVLIF